MASPQNSAIRRKIKKGKVPNDCERQICQLLLDLEASAASTLKADLKPLYIAGAREITVNPNKKAKLIFVPYALRKQFQKIQGPLKQELSKKLSGQTILMIAERQILSRNHKRKKGNQDRPRSRTLTSVHNGMLEDICFPAEIVGKREIFNTSGQRTLKVFLNQSSAASIGDDLDTFNAAFNKLTNRRVAYELEM
jgi:small subunit ribosomal protein S7e